MDFLSLYLGTLIGKSSSSHSIPFKNEIPNSELLHELKKLNNHLDKNLIGKPVEILSDTDDQKYLSWKILKPSHDSDDYYLINSAGVIIKRHVTAFRIGGVY